MTQDFRIKGGLLDENTPINFQFNGKNLKGYQGDTLASALLANGHRMVARSFKYHRPRGIFSAGSEEPNALVQLRTGAYQEPNTRATMVELYEGLTANSQNHRGTLRWDLMAANDLLAPFLGAGFYYKTFMWPAAFWEKIYEPFIRSSAGLGRLSGEEDPDAYDKGYLHCDILIIGAGPSGLTAALSAARSGARVLLADEDFLGGGRLNSETHQVAGQSGADWAKSTLAQLADMPNVRIMPRTTVFGAYDHGVYGAIEKHTDHLIDAAGKPRQIYWKIYSKRAILCAGATERSIAFANNDRPGVMLSGAVRSFANRFGVAAGKSVSIFTNNSSGWDTAAELISKGIEIPAIIDTRDIAPPAQFSGTAIIMGAQVANTSGRRALRSVTLTNGQSIKTDCLAVSGGWSPNVHLTCHQRGRPSWREDIAAFVPDGELPVGMAVAGAGNGDLTLAGALKSGHQVGNATAKNLGFKISRAQAPKSSDETYDISAFWHVNSGSSRAWVDLQNDVTTKDIKISQMEGFHSVEHLKRYTTLGMATDQGKTSNVLGLAIMAEATGKTVPETGTTIFRPPYSPVPLGAFGGRSRGHDFRPRRLTPSHDWASEHGCVFVEAGAWMRAQWYPIDGETHWRESCDREVQAVRNSVGICDVTSLGKIDIQGKDAATLLNRVYSNAFAKLPVGKVRYGLMLREDGMVYDDGTTAHLSENHYVMTTTTVGAGNVYRNLEFIRQCLMPDIDVHIISTTDAWAQFAVAGPKSADVLQKLMDNLDLSSEAFPFMACAETTICGGTPARLFRISFSGERAYEIAVPAQYGDSLVRALMSAGEEFGVTPYGLEALNVMRIEKGHVTGGELNGTVTADMIGLGMMVSTKKDSIGAVLSRREALVADDQYRLVGFKPVDRTEKLTAGAHFIAQDTAPTTENDQGWMSSVCYSPTFEHSIGLGFLKGGAARMGETLRAWDKVREKDVLVEVCSPHFYDPEGEIQRG